MMWQNSNDRTCGIAHMQGLKKTSFIRFFLILSHLSSFITYTFSILSLSLSQIVQIITLKP
ncbi:hypothetical protein Hdeb2414_s0010g00338301 [Helianthus debilis subsp. tardiflorus]